MNAILKNKYIQPNQLYQAIDVEKVVDVKHFIRMHYHDIFKTKDLSFLPNLICQDTDTGNIEYAFGYGSGINRSFYLEHYLSSPIEMIISTMTDNVVERNKIVEVGNFATIFPKNIGLELLALLKYCLRMGYQWVSCTATRVLRIQFIKIGIQAKFISYADKNKLCEKDQAIWGKYYDSKPAVMIADIKASIESIEGKLLKQMNYDNLYDLKTDSFAANLYEII